MQRTNTLMIIAVIVLVAIDMVYAAPEAAQNGDDKVGIALSNLTSDSPVAQLFRAYWYEREGKRDNARDIYQYIFQETPQQSQWSRIANLNLVRISLGDRPSDIALAAQIISRIPSTNTDVAFENERRLWKLVIELNGQVDQWLIDKEATFDLVIDKAVEQWHIPRRLQDDFELAMSSISQRFFDAKQSGSGSRFFHSLFEQTTSPYLMRVTLQHLISQRLAAQEPQGAMTAARAYWLMSVQEPGLLAEAVDYIMACMEASGMRQEAIEAFRIRQMMGQSTPVQGDSADATDLPGQFVHGITTTTLLSPSVIETHASDMTRAKLYLLSGNMQQALPLIKKLRESIQPYSPQFSQLLELIRMAFALSDGHMHAIDRYENYLYRKASGDASVTTRDPLDSLLLGISEIESIVQSN